MTGELSEAGTPNTQALVPLVRKLGGAVVTVLSWQQHAGLSKGLQTALGEIIRAHEALNTEGAVDYLAEAATYHGDELDEWWERDNVWRSEYVRKENGEAPELRMHSFRQSELFGARLVGGLSLDDAVCWHDGRRPAWSLVSSWVAAHRKTRAA